MILATTVIDAQLRECGISFSPGAVEVIMGIQLHRLPFEHLGKFRASPDLFSESTPLSTWPGPPQLDSIMEILQDGVDVVDTDVKEPTMGIGRGSQERLNSGPELFPDLTQPLPAPNLPAEPQLFGAMGQGVGGGAVQCVAGALPSGGTNRARSGLPDVHTNQSAPTPSGHPGIEGFAMMMNLLKPQPSHSSQNLDLLTKFLESTSPGMKGRAALERLKRQWEEGRQGVVVDFMTRILKSRGETGIPPDEVACPHSQRRHSRHFEGCKHLGGHKLLARMVVVFSGLLDSLRRPSPSGRDLWQAKALICTSLGMLDQIGTEASTVVSWEMTLGLLGLPVPAFHVHNNRSKMGPDSNLRPQNGSRFEFACPSFGIFSRRWMPVAHSGGVVGRATSRYGTIIKKPVARFSRALCAMRFEACGRYG